MRKASKGQAKPEKETAPAPVEDVTAGDDSKPTKRSTESLLQSIRDQVRNLYEKVDPIQARFRFRQRPSTAEIMGKPLVVFLGNHSSGKSTFINYVLKRANPDFRDVQKTGVAPLDDASISPTPILPITYIVGDLHQKGFTFIMHGDNPDEQQGPAIVSNTNLPFASLGKFGDQFVQHLRLKMAPVQLLQNVILVDSPGMIDSATEGADRGYDFIKAVRWFAERADYVLVFFDPDKPGTTGESLEVFTKALNGIEHKLLILMNKVDKFQRIDDFSRAFGALCWNLSKVVPYKDIPYIYTTFVPQREESGQRSWSLEEFARSRDEIISKIHHAPSRHMDNMLTELKKYGEQLLMHAKVINAARNQVWWLRLQLWLVVFIVIAAASAVAWKLTKGDELFTALPLLILLPAFLLISWMLSSRQRALIHDLRRVFEKTHEVEVMTKDAREELERQWSTVEQHTVSTIERFGLFAFPTLSKREVQVLDEICRRDVTSLLTQVHKMLSKQKSENQ